MSNRDDVSRDLANKLRVGASWCCCLIAVSGIMVGLTTLAWVQWNVGPIRPRNTNPTWTQNPDVLSFVQMGANSCTIAFLTALAALIISPSRRKALLLGVTGLSLRIAMSMVAEYYWD